MILRMASAECAPLNSAWGDAPGLMWTNRPSALKARVINTVSRAFSAPSYSEFIILGRCPRLGLKSALSALNAHEKGKANLSL
jgi:hypothetical protein